jgi:hypothetical protein
VFALTVWPQGDLTIDVVLALNMYGLHITATEAATSPKPNPVISTSSPPPSALVLPVCTVVMATGTATVAAVRASPWVPAVNNRG